MKNEWELSGFHGQSVNNQKLNRLNKLDFGILKLAKFPVTK